ncbi:MAG: type II toxin-antitoxin system VapC family toxin [Synergistaceae bacterium]|nr:type II toxin-antitoxin system VapC family toxin [Synergistaceae bacterium]
MKLLLDTQMWIWLLFWPENLPLKAREVISDEENDLCFSPANLWEISIKRSRNKPDFQINARVMRENLLDTCCLEIPITSSHTITAGELPALHKDPFDRLLIAQAVVENIFLLTSDRKISEYPAPVIFVPI